MISDRDTAPTSGGHLADADSHARIVPADLDASAAHDAAPQPTPTTITVLAVPADPARPHRLLEVDPADDTALRALSGGGIEPVDLGRAGAVMWMGDPPLPEHTPRNDRATALAAFHPRWFRDDQPIHGDVVITGLTVHGLDDIEVTDVPDVYARLLDASRYRVQVKRESTLGWISLGDRYTGLVAAYQATCDLAGATRRSSRRSRVTARVTPVDSTPPPPAP
ncbi:hypothetical protein [Frankia sp. ACN1ag]|uniref:hypothetical protein n=1 Tax=Frankia sp. ACN1ag TaxID=102891 RepID=UPI0006DC8276|nr:hypothetical protein [Frankia sp. ACN1ag]